MENERMDYPTRKALVYTTADELVASGIKPTMDLVRSKVGGSYSTLSKILAEWKRDKAQEKVVEQAAPETVTMMANRMASEIWAIASSESQLALVALRETVTAENVELKQELAAIIQTADALQLKTEAHDEEVIQIRRELERANEARQELDSKLQLAESILAQRETRIEELKTEIERMRSTGESATLQQEIETLRHEVSRLADQYTQIAGKK